MALAAYNRIAQNDAGDIQANCTVTVTDKVSGMPSEVWADRDGTTSLGSSFTSLTGEIKFYANPGRYKVVATKGLFTATFDDELIGTVADDGISEPKLATDSVSRRAASSDIVTQVATISDLISLTGVSDGQRVVVTSYHAGWAGTSRGPIGGGGFVWDASRSKADHDGGYVIDPDKTFPIDWNDRAQLYAWFDGTGSVGTGCFVAVSETEEVNIQRYGCWANGVDDDSVQVQRALLSSVNSGLMSYAPAGTYLKGFALDTTWAIAGSRWYEFTYPADALIGMRGDGKGVTVFKVADGLISARGRFTYTFGTASGTVGDMIQRDYTIDQNGTNNPLGGGDPLYEFEQAHCWNIGAHNDRVFSDIEIVDKVGGGIVHSAGASNYTKLDGITSRDFSDNFGQRGDIEFQGFPRVVEVIGPKVDYLQTEPNSLNPDGFITRVQIIGGEIGVLDCAGVNNNDLTEFDLIGVKTTIATILSSSTILAQDCDFAIQGNAASEWNDPQLTVNGGKIRFLVDTGDISYIYPRVVSDVKDYKWDFNNVEFLIESSDPGFVPAGNGRVFNMLSAYSGTNDHVLRIKNNCRFDPRFKQICNQYRSFQLEVENSTIRCSGDAFLVGTDRDNGQRVKLRNNDYSDFAGTRVLSVTLTAGNAPFFSVDILEKLDASKWAIGGSGGVNLELSGNYSVNVELIGDTEPTTGKFNGVRQYRQTPTSAEWFLKSYSGGATTTQITSP